MYLLALIQNNISGNYQITQITMILLMILFYENSNIIETCIIVILHNKDLKITMDMGLGRT